jgi:hypothetical protein
MSSLMKMLIRLKGESCDIAKDYIVPVGLNYKIFIWRRPADGLKSKKIRQGI